MIRVHTALSMPVTGTFATEKGEIIRLHVARRTIVAPPAPVFTGIDREIHVVVIEIGVFPVCRIMAIRTVCGEAGTGVIGVVVGLMTRDTVLVASGGWLESQRILRNVVARRTLDLVVSPEQVEAVGGIYMVENGIGPGLSRMARSAGGREVGSGMVGVVVGLVACDTILVAGRRRLEEHGEVGHAVAGLTLELLMRAEEVKTA